VRVAGLAYRDELLESLGGGRRREIQEDGLVMEVNFLFI